MLKSIAAALFLAYGLVISPQAMEEQKNYDAFRNSPFARMVGAVGSTPYGCTTRAAAAEMGMRVANNPKLTTDKFIKECLVFKNEADHKDRTVFIRSVVKGELNADATLRVHIMEMVDTTGRVWYVWMIGRVQLPEA